MFLHGVDDVGLAQANVWFLAVIVSILPSGGTLVSRKRIAACTSAKDL
jgi:hypothetical protein